jgi:hypothetical protein
VCPPWARAAGADPGIRGMMGRSTAAITPMRATIPMRRTTDLVAERNDDP